MVTKSLEGANFAVYSIDGELQQPVRWQIEQYLFCDKQQHLQVDDEQHQLEPMVAELLKYFCEHPEQIVSRDQLIEHVWMGRVVSDNAVNRVVTKLRKAFDDDAKKPRFIATLPKKGYKFIASVKAEVAENTEIVDTEIVNNEKPKPNVDNQKALVSFPITLISAFVLVVLSVVLYWSVQSRSVAPQNTIRQVQALTREAGRESAPRVSPNQKYLAYAERKNQKMSLWIKSLENQERVEIDHGPEAWVGPASWNEDGSLIAYLVTTSDSCMYFLRQFNKLKLSEPKLIYECPAGSYGKIEFLHSNSRFVFTEAPGPDTPYSLYELNTQTGQKRRLAQPDLVLGGNSQFDVHPTDNKILISSPDEKQWEGFYSLDVDTDELSLLFEQDAYICCGIWDHSGARVVLMGEHPAFELVSYDQNGNDARVIYSGMHQLRSPHRHSNGNDYLFVSGHVNQNIHYWKHEAYESTVLINNSVDDRLATYSKASGQVAYISLASGSEEVWVSDLNGNQKKLTSFNDSRHYFDLHWLPDGSKIVGLTLNEVHLIDAQQGIYIKLEIGQKEIRGLSAKDINTIAFSLKVGEQWQLHFYDLKTNKLSVADQQWQYVRFSEEPQNSLWVDQDNKLYIGKDRKPMPFPKGYDSDELMLSKLLNLQKLGSRYAWQRFNDGKYQLFEQGTDGEVELILTTDSRHFHLSELGYLYQEVETANADIYSTSSN